MKQVDSHYETDYLEGRNEVTLATSTFLSGNSDFVRAMKNLHGLCCDIQLHESGSDKKIQRKRKGYVLGAAIVGKDLKINKPE